MVYTKRHPAVLIMGIALLALGYCTEAGLLDGVMKYLGTASSKGAMMSLPYIFGAIGVVVGLWQLIGLHREGSLDYVSSALGGALFILVIAMLGPLVPRSAGGGVEQGDRAGVRRQVHSRRVRTQLHRARHRRRHRPGQCVRHPELGAERRADCRASA